MNSNRIFYLGRKLTKYNCVGLSKTRYQSTKSACIIGCYKVGDQLKLTNNGTLLNEKTGNKLYELLHSSNFKSDVGKTRTFFGLHEHYPCITVAGLGDQDIKYDPNEERDDKKENIRIAIGAAASAVQSYDFKSIEVDGCGDATAAAEGANLSLYKYDELKTKKSEKVDLNLLNINTSDTDVSNWKTGTVLSKSQNFARSLMEMPSNYKPPHAFAQLVAEKFSSRPDIRLKIRDEQWAKGMKMHCFLSVGQGSVERSAFLEINYKGNGGQPVVLVGKGITFDTGGISIKPSSGMPDMRADMGGAATVLGTLDAVVNLRLPINLVVLIPLAENMPSGSATKPGDVFTAMNGKTVEVDNTDAEGRLVLADALCYAGLFKPSHIINVATLTGAIDVALGGAATGTFTTSNDLWNIIHQSGMKSGDRMWRMPIYNYYTKQMECSMTADLRNTQKKARSAGSSTAAAFLREFVDIENWAHLDIAGVMKNEGDVPYLGAGMSGRPTRTLIETVRNLSVDNK